MTLHQIALEQFDRQYSKDIANFVLDNKTHSKMTLDQQVIYSLLKRSVRFQDTDVNSFSTDDIIADLPLPERSIKTASLIKAIRKLLRYGYIEVVYEPADTKSRYQVTERLSVMIEEECAIIRNPQKALLTAETVEMLPVPINGNQYYRPHANGNGIGIEVMVRVEDKSMPLKLVRKTYKTIREVLLTHTYDEDLELSFNMKGIILQGAGLLKFMSDVETANLLTIEERAEGEVSFEEAFRKHVVNVNRLRITTH